MDAGARSNVENIKDKAQDVRDDINAMAVENLEALRKAVDALLTQLKANALTARDLGFEKLDDASASIRRNPLAAVALAAGVGLIVGLWRHSDAQ